MVAKSVYEEVAGLDEGMAVSFNDIDFCLKLIGGISERFRAACAVVPL